MHSDTLEFAVSSYVSTKMQTSYNLGNFKFPKFVQHAVVGYTHYFESPFRVV